MSPTREPTAGLANCSPTAIHPTAGRNGQAVPVLKRPLTGLCQHQKGNVRTPATLKVTIRSNFGRIDSLAGDRILAKFPQPAGTLYRCPNRRHNTIMRGRRHSG
jgi:hypothetical protein